MIATGMLLLSSLVATAVPAPEGAPPTIAVMPMAHQRLGADVVQVLDEVLVSAVHELGTQKVLGASDINAMLGLERMKEAAGCDELSCAAEIGGALGVGLLVAGSASGLGDEVIINLKLIDIGANEVRARAEVAVQNDERLYRGAVRAAAAKLFGGSPPVTAPVAHATPSADAPAPALAALAAEPEPRFEDYGDYLERKDWERYERYRRGAGRAVSVEEWVLESNQESRVASGLEVALPLFATPMLVLGLANARDEDALGGGAVLTTGVLALATWAAILIGDFTNSGGVQTLKPLPAASR